MVTKVRLKAKGMEMYKSGIVINYVNAVLLPIHTNTVKNQMRNAM